MANKRIREKQEKKREQQRLAQQREDLKRQIDKAHEEALVQNDIFDREQLYNKIGQEMKEIKGAQEWQSIVDDAHQEALLEDASRTKQSEYYEAKEAARKNIYTPEQIDALHSEALIENKARDAVDTATYYTNTAEDAHTYLNKMARNSEISVDELNMAHSHLTKNVDDYFVPEIPKTVKVSSKRVNLKAGDKTYKLKGDIQNPNVRKVDGAKLNPKYFGGEVANPKYVEKYGLPNAEDVIKGTDDLGNTHLKKALNGRNLNALFNLGLSIVDYKDARASGDGVIKAGAKAGAQFVAGEMLGMWMMPVALAKSVPTLAIKGIETTQSITRNMNSSSRIQTFGEAEFHDTQQLATMRQAGMELAKMSQYNLQQSIMGNEAQYMHRL